MVMSDDLFKYQRPPAEISFEFRVVPSWNDILSGTQSKNVNFNPVANDIKKWRERSRKRAEETFKALGMETIMLKRETRAKNKDGSKKIEYYQGLETPFFREPTACIVCLWRPSAADFDVPNLVVKPIIDGFGDVQLFETDAVRGFPELAFSFEGVDPSLKLTDLEKLERKAYADTYRNRGKNPPRMPLPSRIRFDFYRLSRIKYSTILQFELIDIDSN